MIVWLLGARGRILYFNCQRRLLTSEMLHPFAGGRSAEACSCDQRRLSAGAFSGSCARTSADAPFWASCNASASGWLADEEELVLGAALFEGGADLVRFLGAAAASLMISESFVWVNASTISGFSSTTLLQAAGGRSLCSKIRSNCAVTMSPKHVSPRPPTMPLASWVWHNPPGDRESRTNARAT